MLLQGRKNVAAKLESPQTFTTSNGQGCFGYGEESTIRSLRGKIVNALHLGERSKASSLLSDLGRGNYSLRANDFVHILEYCARSPDPLFAMETWRVMEEKEVVVNNKCWLLSIQALCKGGYLEEAFKLLNFLGENHDVYPTLPIYNNFLGACTRMRSVHHANQCLDLMERQVVGKDEVTYSELLKLAVLQENLSAVYEIWNEYIKYYSLSIIALRKFVWSFTSLRDLKSAYETLQRMVGLASRGSIFINKNAEGKFYSSRLNIPIPSNNELGLKKCGMKKNEHSVPLIYDGCKKINTHAGNTKNCTILGMGSGEVESLKVNILKKNKSMPVMKVLRWSFNDVIRACAKPRNYKLAEQLILQMQNLGLKPSCHTYDGYIRAVVSREGYSKGMEVLKVMQQKNLKPYNSTLATISISCSKVLELDLAEALLDQVSETKSVRPFNAFLAACDSMDQPERAVRMMSKMRQLKLQPDIRTYELLFSLFGNVNAPYEEGNMLSQVDAAKRINAIEMDMVNHGIQHSYLSMRNLLKALGKEGTIRDLKALGTENQFCCSNTYLGKPIYNTVLHTLVKAKELKAFGTKGTIRDPIQYLSVAKNQFCRSNTYLGTPIYNAVLHSLVEAKESHMAIEIFKNMRSCHCLPDAMTYNIMIDCCSIIRCYKSACGLVSMMVRDGYCLQRVTYTTLIKVLLECEDFDGALNRMDQASSEGIKPDLLLYNTSP
ncbi:hypothetical protein L1049_026845 [Liquidambar formosana]|uniref:Pentatricopeptide repeat-containing protein n=1 Tax=Liquidambar formosana TaxID=63359 RepID=A0AAP0NE36_LIQFO